MSQNHKSINIDVFGGVAGSITHDGAKHDVLHFNGEEFRALRSEAGADILTAYGIAERIVPTLGAEVVWKLTGVQIGAIIAIADGRVADVEAQFPNGTGPETTEPQSSPSPA